jgi:hypothetical protein
MLTIHRRSVSSKELLKVGVEAAKRAAPVDITTLPVKMAVVLDGVHPVAGDYQAATWETIGGKTYAAALLGPGGITLSLTDEVYIPWVQVTAGPEIIEARCFEDVIEVY